SEGGWPQPVTALDEPVHFLHWSPDGKAIAFTVAPGGGMNEQVYTVRPDGTGLRRLTDGGKETNRLGRWTHDGKALMLASNRRAPAAMDAYLVDAATGRLSLVAETRGVGGLTDVSRDGRRAVLNRQVSRGDEDLFRRTLSIRQVVSQRSLAVLMRMGARCWRGARSNSVKDISSAPGASAAGTTGP